MPQKFAMGAQTLGTLQKQTGSRSEDLGALVRKFAQDAAPLEGKMNGTGRAAFDNFKLHVDDLANELDAALTSVLAGIGGQNTAFVQGGQSQSEAVRSTQAAVNFDAARFH